MADMMYASATASNQNGTEPKTAKALSFRRFSA
jgi:hypothetical protein